LELAMVRALLGIRVFVLGQAAVALAAGSLSRSDNPPLDAVLRAVMIAQAQAKHEQMRSYVDGTGGGPAVRARIDGVLRLHPGLSVRSQVEVGPDTELPAEILNHRERALDTALANAEQHAPDANVVLSVRSGTDLLSVTVRDDGPGFDAVSSPPGFGISEILCRQLAGVGGTSVVESCPARALWCGSRSRQASHDERPARAPAGRGRRNGALRAHRRRAQIPAGGRW